MNDFSPADPSGNKQQSHNHRSVSSAKLDANFTPGVKKKVACCRFCAYLRILLHAGLGSLFGLRPLCCTIYEDTRLRRDIVLFSGSVEFDLAPCKASSRHNFVCCDILRVCVCLADLARLTFRLKLLQYCSQRERQRRQQLLRGAWRSTSLAGLVCENFCLCLRAVTSNIFII